MTAPVITLRSALRQWKLATLAFFALASLLPAQAGSAPREPELPVGCEDLQVPAGNRVSFRTFAAGFQVYRWNTTTSSWEFLRPAAMLFADAACHQPIGIHFAGPTWLSISGSAVVGSVAERSTVDPTAIPWLLLRSVESEGHGPFAATTWIQRVNTVGGLAPSHAGHATEMAWVPYTAEYYFYRAR